MTPERIARIRQTLDQRQPDLRVVADQIHKPRNISALIRTCDAFAVANLHAVWNRDGYRAFRKTTGGSYRWVTTHTHRTTGEAIGALRDSGHRIVTAHLSERAVDYRDLDYTRPIAIVMGSELEGAGQDAIDQADDHVVVPMMGMVESLNVSSACAIILAEAQRQRLEAGLFDHPRLPDDEYRSLFFRWSQPTVARYCDDRRLPYPEIDLETGDLVDGVGWMEEVREIRGKRRA
ncbi:tRNA (guanosine-2'-O-)-methyltransferase [Tamilnaduibacter salinus]|uniref:tRNA (guanosine(18)-2'-O)-methyltransferase n=1 Tax=Tamilnaduibacter salinus TaxID=1484056 RepID=A0A2A2I4I2_9GAMM|nr:tRNA (guanosine(18)-2'-O)-methyltransferase TrmH [Tamilnaduibacter salinus]PAV26206.1 tRNA (guanosine(18)-2'-O)-methyltransferase TrmH [Tamilnaduibacter salinus]PVY70739.1 tRNA (guanosine-2'-O-)-methyltransferase [Tamilnaduibacter salinus]